MDTIALKPMSRELFVASTGEANRKTAPLGSSIDQMVDQLDLDGYWDQRPRSVEQKRSYVKRKMQTMRDENGRRIFYGFKGREIVMPRLASTF